MMLLDYDELGRIGTGKNPFIAMRCGLELEF